MVTLAENATTSFNVAMIFQSWKSKDRMRSWRKTGMLQCGHDFSIMEIKNKRDDFACRSSCFNVAMIFQSWKSEPKPIKPASWLELQCGHDFSIMEISIIFPDGSMIIQASMWP